MSGVTGRNRLLLALLALAAAGCRIDMEARTEIFPDGSCERRARYLAFESADREEVDRFYRLPPGGAWSREAVGVAQAGEDAAREANVYAASARYAPGEAISDYARGASGAPAFSQNAVRITSSSRGLVRRVTFRAEYADTANPAGFEPAARGAYAFWKEYFGAQLAEELNDAVTLAQGREAASRVFDGLAEKAIQAYARNGRPWLQSPEFEKGILPQTEDAAMASAILSQFRVPPGREEAWGGAVVVAAQQAGSFLQRAFEESDVDERMFGVYGPVLVSSYGFQEAVEMPGYVIRSNATEKSGSRLVWRFTPAAFERGPYVLTATSVMPHAGRVIALLGGLLLAGLSFAAWVRRNRGTGF